MFLHRAFSAVPLWGEYFLVDGGGLVYWGQVHISM